MKPTDNSFPAGNVTSLAERKAAKLAYFNREKYGSIIRAARLKKGINQPELARILNNSKNYVSNWEVGKARPDLNMIPGLCEALGISLNTFFGQAVFTEELTSEDRRVLSNYHYLSQQNRQVIDQLMATMLDVQARNLRKYVQENFQRVWYDDLKTSAGTGNPLDEGGHGVYIYLRADRNVCRADAVITVSGDSMEPDLHDGDDILVQYADAISPGEVGVFVADGEGFVKEYQPDGLHSHNSKYPVLHFNDDDNVRCIGRVIGIVPIDARPTEMEQAELDDLQHEAAQRH